jgi:hypothetical protein
MPASARSWCESHRRKSPRSTAIYPCAAIVAKSANASGNRLYWRAWVRNQHTTRLKLLRRQPSRASAMRRSSRFSDAAHALRTRVRGRLNARATRGFVDRKSPDSRGIGMDLHAAAPHASHAPIARLYRSRRAPSRKMSYASSRTLTILRTSSMRSATSGVRSRDGSNVLRSSRNARRIS